MNGVLSLHYFEQHVARSVAVEVAEHTRDSENKLVGLICKCGNRFPIVPSDFVKDEIKKFPNCVLCGRMVVAVASYHKNPGGCLWVGNGEQVDTE